jgi:hypothetical protein
MLPAGASESVACRIAGSSLDSHPPVVADSYSGSHSGQVQVATQARIPGWSSATKLARRCDLVCYGGNGPHRLEVADCRDGYHLVLVTDALDGSHSTSVAGPRIGSHRAGVADSSSEFCCSMVTRSRWEFYLVVVTDISTEFYMWQGRTSHVECRLRFWEVALLGPTR